MRVSLYLSVVSFLNLALYGILGPKPAYGHHDPTDMVDIFGSLRHLPTMVWVILLAVLGVLLLAIAAILVAKPKKPEV